MMPKIAVIIPFYTPDKLTQSLHVRCFESVSSDFIVIPSDDNIIRGGAASARNRGLNYAFENYTDLEYITFLDADDEFASNAYIEICEAIKEAPKDTQLIQMNHKRVFSDGRQKLRQPNKAGIYTLNKLPNLWMSSVNKVYKADLLKDIRFDETLNHGEDEIFILMCLLKSRILYCSERVAMLHHKDNPNSLSTITSFEDLISEQKALLNFMVEHKDDKEIYAAIYNRQSELWGGNPTYKRIFTYG